MDSAKHQDEILSKRTRRSHPAQHGETFDGPSTIKRSGSEHRRAVTSSRP